MDLAWPRSDAEIPDFLAGIGLDGIIDIHVHHLPPRLQQAVWRYFDGLEEPPWPISYREDEPTRLATLRSLGVRAHTALAYAHKPGVARWCNEHTLALADANPQVIPSFTFYPEPEAPVDVAHAIARGGRVAKAHLQVGRFHATDPRLDEVWPQLARAGVPTVVHASAVYGVEGGHEYCGPDGIRALLERHPDVRVVIAHLGMPDAEGFLDLAAQATNVWLDTTMMLTDPPFLQEYPRALLPRLAGLHDRILFGSDFPSIPHPYVAQVRGLAQLELDTSALRAVLRENARRLLGATA